MKTSTLSVAAVVCVQLLLSFHQAEGLFFTSLALLPFGALASLGGLAAIKVAIAMKLLGHLGWFKVSRYGVGLRASIDNQKFAERLVPAPPKSKGLFDGPSIKVPVNILPYVLGVPFKKATTFKLPGKDFVLRADQSAKLASSHSSYSSHGAAGIDGTKWSFLQHAGNLKTPLVNVDDRKKVSYKSKRSAPSDLKIVDQAFALVHELDTDGCVLRLTCEVSASPTDYGKYGERVDGFVNSMGPVSESSSVFDYAKAYRKGKSAGQDACTSDYPTCKLDLKGLAAMIDP